MARTHEPASGAYSQSPGTALGKLHTINFARRSLGQALTKFNQFRNHVSGDSCAAILLQLRCLERMQCVWRDYSCYTVPYYLVRNRNGRSLFYSWMTEQSGLNFA